MFHFIKENVRWLLGGFLLTFFSTYGQTFFIAIWGEEIRSEFSLSHGDFGILYMVATIASAISITYIGKFVDVFRIWLCSFVVIIVLAVACLLMATSHNIAMLFLTIFMLRLFGQGMMGHIAITAMGRWYVNNRGKAVAIAGMGYQVAEGIIPFLFFLLATMFYWRTIWIISALSLIIIALPAIITLLKVRRTPKGKVKKSENEDSDWTRSQVVKDKWFWILSIGILSPPFIGTSIWFHQAYLIEVNGWEPAVWYSSFSVLAIATISSSLLIGEAVDRYTATRLLPIFLLPLSLSCFLLGFFNSSFMIFVIMFLLGVSHGTTATLFGSIWPEIYGTKNLGAIRSISMALMVFASAGGPGVTGYLIDIGIPFPDQLIYIAFYCLLCVPIMWLGSREFVSRGLKVEN